MGFVRSRNPLRFHRRFGIKASDPAVILFTSGSEGNPKAVVLSHGNIQANRLQVSSRIAFNSTDTVLNALPVFHSFGLTGGLLIPLLAGVKTFLYPSPLHYRIIPEIAYSINATVLFATNTFLAGYARMAHPYDFYSVRMIVTGGERVTDAVRQIMQDKFGHRIMEGYGATETSPVLSLNTPMHYRRQTVGRFLPGVRVKIEAIPGVSAPVAEGRQIISVGRLFASGPNIMLGYMKADNPGVLQPLDDGWYDTGDIVALDSDGYCSIIGRLKRQAKPGAEMVSLDAAEDLANATWPGFRNAVVAVPCPRKGEKLILVTEQAGAAVGDVLRKSRELGVGEIMVPREIMHVRAIPLLGTGKFDYPAVSALVDAWLLEQQGNAADLELSE